MAWGIREMIPLLKRRWVRKRVDKIKTGYDGISQILDALEDGRRASRCSRALLLVSRNSGGIPVPGVSVKVSIRYESASDNTRRIHQDFQDWDADAPYCEILRTIAVSGGAAIMLRTEKLKPGVLKDLYETDGIVGSKVFLLGHVPDGNWMAYASFNFSEWDDSSSHPITPAQSEALRSCVTRMRNILSNYHEILI